MKKIAILGSTGSTGKEVVRLALAANYKVTAVERTPTSTSALTALTTLQGDVKDVTSLEKAFEGVDAVISCFGPSNHRAVGNLMSVGTSNLIAACETRGVPRLVFMSGFLQADSQEFSWWNRKAIQLLRLYYQTSYNDKVIAEADIQKSRLNWVIVRAVALAHSAPTGSYKAGVKVRVAPFRALSYTDCAQCLLDAVEMPNWTNQLLNVGRS